MHQQKETNSDDQAASIFKNLNDWMEQVYNSETGDIESTGEGQAAIQRYLNELDELGVKYELKINRYQQIPQQ